MNTSYVALEAHIWIDMCPLLTVIGVVTDDMVSPTPVPEKKSCVPGPRNDVAVSSDVRFRPGQTRHHIPVAKNYLCQFA